ncbi:hypothetical protein FGM00_14225 [Aggregatimonas sangjinii]|uniref:Fibronectin type-III domain-containing protein n=1 Tax=Aggregatimonas sangjinii TaxID=2583587 RepID=A0A5B7SWB5_9FLAO|nr:fibronectin type III domain-containing protein [Aggregatimonas sangjinii]QCX01211.1 hypothetical protein FGM00_14225 [Aggregatimonas sangjinii]
MEIEEKRIFRWALMLALMLLLVLGCNKDDSPIAPKPDVIDKPDPVNRAPNDFLLLTPESDSTIVNRRPTFSWEQATDPDGGSVTYDLYLDTQDDPGTLLAKNLGTTSFKLTENLDFETQYYWKVVAKDAKGATSESSRPLIIKIPIKWLIHYDANNEGGPIEFDFDNGKLTKFDDYLTTYQGDPSRLERLRNSKNEVYEYKYTTSGKQLEVSVGDGHEGMQWTFEYDDSDRATIVTKVTIIDLGKGGISVVEDNAVFKYNDATSEHPAEIEISFEDEVTFRNTLQWEGDNIVEILSEVDYGLGSGFQFEALVKIAYDDNINPYSRIISEQFGFGSFNMLTNTPTGMESFDFGIIQWQSFNNITAYEVFDEQDNLSLGDTYYFDYVYGHDDYPISAMLGNRKRDWRYLDE